jgi:hypothetical protein
VQVCPTGALVEKGQSVEEMVKRSNVVTQLAVRREGPVYDEEAAAGNTVA